MILTSRESSLGFLTESEPPPIPSGVRFPLFFVTDGDGVDSSGAFLRQTVLFTAYETPETRSLFNKSLKNVAGKIRSEHIWPPLQVPEGLEPVGVFGEPYLTLLTTIARTLSALVVQV